MRHQRARSIGVLLVIVALLGTACGSNDNPVAEGPTTTAKKATATSASLTVTTKDYAFDVPPGVTAGATEIKILNKGTEVHHAQVFKINDGKTIADVGQQLATGDLGKLLTVGVFMGGSGATDPGASSVANGVPVLTEGSYAFMCFLPTADGTPHVAKGMVTPFTVGQAATGAATAVDTDGDIWLLDYAYTVPRDLKAGTYNVVNKGQEPHEVTIAKLADGADAAAAIAFFDKPTGRPPFTSVGGMQALLPGSSQALRLTLSPGTYAFMCHIPSVKDGEAHYKKGMVTTVTIT